MEGGLVMGTAASNSVPFFIGIGDMKCDDSSLPCRLFSWLTEHCLEWMRTYVLLLLLQHP